MPKNPSDWLKILTLAFGCLVAGIGGAMTYGSLQTRVAANTADVKEIKTDFRSLDDPIGKLEVAIGKLTTAVKMRHEPVGGD